jgi:hypothetical protein
LFTSIVLSVLVAERQRTLARERDWARRFSLRRALGTIVLRVGWGAGRARSAARRR